MMALAPLAMAAAAETAGVDASRRVTTVKADPRSGRLVRRVVVSPRSVAPIEVTPQPAPGGNAPLAPGLRLAPDPAVDQMVETAARKYDVDPLLVHSVIKVESNYNPGAVSAKGAQGLMQLIPSTARRFGVKNSFSARENIEGGVRYLKYLQTLYNNDLRLALAAYNAGEGAVAKFNWIPPYPETQNYVYQVGKHYGQARRAAEVKKARETAQSPKAGGEQAHAAAPEPQPRPVEQVVDSLGRIVIRTR
jgi:soluble lytic murein transglycosylase-like protein